MSDVDADIEETNTEPGSAPRIVLPTCERISDEERQRRRVLFARTMRLREEIGTIDIPTYELVRVGRDE